MSLSKLLIPEGASPIPPAWKQNAVLDHLLAQRLLGAVVQGGGSRPFPHPWRVSARRWEKVDRSSLDPARTWRIEVAAGTVNDRLAPILYLRTADPRGWVPPKDYAEAAGTPDPRWIERDALDDPDDPPCLVLRDPPSVTGDATADFTRIADAARPGIEGGAFCGEDDWDQELWRAHVILSASPLRATLFAAELPPPRLTRHRLYTVPKKPSVPFGARAGGWLELATVYLLRNPNSPADAEIRIRQRCFWNLWSIIAQPGGDLVDIFDAAADGSILPGIFTDLLRGELQDVLAGAATAEFWTV